MMVSSKSNHILELFILIAYIIQKTRFEMKLVYNLGIFSGLSKFSVFHSLNLSFSQTFPDTKLSL